VAQIYMAQKRGHKQDILKAVNIFSFLCLLFPFFFLFFNPDNFWGKFMTVISDKIIFSPCS
jgi:hypothetical protein